MTTITPAPVRNGIDTAQVYGTLDALKAQPELARFEFRVENRWISGPHSRSTIHGFWGAGQEDTSRETPFVVDASEPPVLFGHNEAPNPAEFLLHALAGCLTLTIVNVAAARKVTLTEISSTLEGVLDARGATGLDTGYRNGFERIRVSFSIKGDAPREKLEEIVERAKARSVVYDIVSNPVPVDVVADGRLAMPMELRARTPEGAALVASAERLADDLAAGAAARDRDRSYPFEGIDALRRAGYFGAPVPEQLGGLGRGLHPRRGDRLGPAGARRRVARDRRQHAPGRRPEPGAPLARWHERGATPAASGPSASRCARSPRKTS